jgi:hypothetical protein
VEEGWQLGPTCQRVEERGLYRFGVLPGLRVGSAYWAEGFPEAQFIFFFLFFFSYFLFSISFTDFA